MRARVFIVLMASLGLLPLGQADTSVSYPAKPGAGKGKHVVLLSGDEEYRSEEALYCSRSTRMAPSTPRQPSRFRIPPLSTLRMRSSCLCASAPGRMTR
jgi:hypothetical protein